MSKIILSKHQNMEDFKQDIIEKMNSKRNTLNTFLGYRSRKIPPIINRKIEEETKTIENYLDMEYEYKVFEKDGKYFAYVIYTVGNKIENLIESYTKNAESIRALIMDKLSIVALDCIQELILEQIQEEKDLYASKEISPGNKNFPLENQKKILGIMDNIEKISVNEYYQLFPVKSVALKFELSNQKKIYSRCEDCENPCELHKKTEDVYKEMYHRDRETFHKNILENSPSPYEEMYKILKEISKDTLSKYKEEGISESIYYETMSDIDLWAEEYKKKNGVLGIKEYKWVEKSIDMKVFKLGRLQFEIVEDEQTKKYLESIGIHDDIMILNTHIQAGEPLEFELCQESYKKAVEFFMSRDKEKRRIVFVCDSWLLNPKLQILLSEESNIVKFQKQYKIISEDIDDRQMEKRLFNTLEECPKDYNAVTTLQKKIKAALINGEKFGTAKGINMKEQKR
ncbi:MULTISPECIES: acyltransferase domain-containing protein [Bacillota]|uniref:acyltransferase domain-containing protein n=1 Tax=Bacillota TaxID=1239 RepID=UPI003F9523BA